MSKDRAPKETLKDKRSIADKALDLLKAVEPSDKDIKAFIRKFKARNQGNPKEAGASIEVTEKKIRKPKTGPIGAISEADRKLLKEALPNVKGGGLMEATAKLKAKGMKEGGMVVKDKTVAIDKSPNSGLITVKGFGAGRRT